MRDHEMMKPAARIAAASEMWISAWMRPWTVLHAWNDYWREQWMAWLALRTATPAAWLPALAGERLDQPDAINYFLPWLPRIDARVVPLDSSSDKDAKRVMLRASLPGAGTSGRTDWLTVDATIRHSAGGEAPPPAAVSQAEVLDAPKIVSDATPSETRIGATPEPRAGAAPAPLKAARESAAPGVGASNLAAPKAAAPEAAAPKAAAPKAAAPKAAAPKAAAPKAAAPKAAAPKAVAPKRPAAPKEAAARKEPAAPKEAAAPTEAAAPKKPAAPEKTAAPKKPAVPK